MPLDQPEKRAIIEMRVDQETIARVCSCCGDNLHVDDFPRADEFLTIADLTEKYGAVPCHGCCDAHRVCDFCGGLIGPDDDWTHSDNGNLECETCRGAGAALVKEQRLLEKTERARCR